MTIQLLANHPFVNIAIRAFILLVVTAGVAFACRRRSAAVIHRIWVLGFCGCLVVPVATLLCPGWTLRIGTTASLDHAHSSIHEATRAHAPHTGSPPDSSFSMVAPQPVEPASSPAARHTSPAIQQPNPEPSDEIRRPAVLTKQEPLSLTTGVAMIWCLGTLLILLRLLNHVLVTQRTLRQCTKIESEEWCNLRDEVARQLTGRLNVVLKRHPGIISPMAAGLIHPVVLLPADAETWSIERRRQVLLHEMAHIQRWDVLTQMMASIVCALYWFNPLAWWGATRLKKLREIACDDAVVTYTSDASRYAQTLLEVAKECRSRQRICTVAMSRR